MAVKYLDGSDYCGWCKKELFRVDGERAKHFCSDDCRYKYHNAQKKVKKESDKAWASISFLQSMMLKDGELGSDALKAVHQLMMHVKTIEFECKCGDCGQYHFFIPARGERCDFCQADNWIFFEKKKNPANE